jgi:RNA polymerase sigma factor (sigma-70 family)
LKIEWVIFLSTTNIYTEHQLVSLLKDRNDKAFGYLYDNYSGSLYTIISQIVIDLELANDVLQEVFINIWRKIESYDSTKGRLFTWMLNIARNASIDTLRSKGYQNSQKNQAMPEHEDWNIGGQSGINVDHIGFRKILERLKREHRVLIELAYFKGYTHEEISGIENIPLGTVKTRIRNALMQLREYLQ